MKKSRAPVTEACLTLETFLNKAAYSMLTKTPSFGTIMCPTPRVLQSYPDQQFRIEWEYHGVDPLTHTDDMSYDQTEKITAEKLQKERLEHVTHELHKYGIFAASDKLQQMCVVRMRPLNGLYEEQVADMLFARVSAFDVTKQLSKSPGMNFDTRDVITLGKKLGMSDENLFKSIKTYFAKA